MDQPGRFIFIFRSEIERIKRELTRRPSIETGGDLFGFWQHDGSPIVYCALGPGPRARHHATAFYQDVDWLEQEGRRLNDGFGLQHVGEWHSHHQLNLFHPSGGDVSTIQYAMNRHRFERFALVICNVELSQNTAAGGVKSLTLSAFLFDRKQRRHYVETPWIVLPKQSPLSDAAEDATPCCSDVTLRPRVASLDALRGRSAQTQPVASLGPNWFADPLIQQRLQTEMQRFEALGIKAKMMLSKDNQLSIKTPLRDGVLHYRLFDGFPQRAPSVVFADDRSREQPVNLSWNDGLRLADSVAQAGEAIESRAPCDPAGSPQPTMRNAVIELQRLEQGKGRNTTIKINASCFELEVPYEFGVIRFCLTEPPEPVRVFNRNLKGREVEIPLKCNAQHSSPDLPHELYHEIENWIQT